jgi:hypothetical protein
LIAQVVLLLLMKAHPLPSQSAGRSPLLFPKNLSFLKLLRLSLVAEEVTEDEGAEEAEEAEAVAVVAVVDEAEVVVVGGVLQHSAATTPPTLLLLPLQRAVVEFEAEAAVAVEPETSRLPQSVHSTIANKS